MTRYSQGIEIAAQYFHEQGLDGEDIDILVEELGIMGLSDLICDIVEETVVQGTLFTKQGKPSKKPKITKTSGFEVVSPKGPREPEPQSRPKINNSSRQLELEFPTKKKPSSRRTRPGGGGFAPTTTAPRERRMPTGRGPSQKPQKPQGTAAERRAARRAGMSPKPQPIRPTEPQYGEQIRQTSETRRRRQPRQTVQTTSSRSRRPRPIEPQDTDTQVSTTRRTSASRTTSAALARPTRQTTSRSVSPASPGKNFNGKGEFVRQTPAAASATTQTRPRVRPGTLIHDLLKLGFSAAEAKKKAESEARGKGLVGRIKAIGTGIQTGKKTYAALPEQVELWVEQLLDEGYDLSQYTWDDMYNLYIEESFNGWVDDLIEEGYDLSEYTMDDMIDIYEEGLINEMHCASNQPKRRKRRVNESINSAELAKIMVDLKSPNPKVAAAAREKLHFFSRYREAQNQRSLMSPAPDR